MLFVVENIYTKEIKNIVGFSFANACDRANINPVIWNILEVDFIYD